MYRPIPSLQDLVGYLKLKIYIINSPKLTTFD